MMTKKKIEQLLELIEEVIRSEQPVGWMEKRDAILAEAGEGDKINLEEFASWFSEEETS